MDSKLKSAEEMPGSFGLPLIGETSDIASNLEMFYWQRYWKYGSCFKSAFVGKKYAFLVGWEANKLVLLDQADKLSTRLGWEVLEPTLTKDALLLQVGNQHRASRKMMMPLFHHQAIASYFETMQSLVSSMVKSWGKQKTISLDAELRKLTLKAIVRIFLGSESTEEIENINNWFTILSSSQVALWKWDSPLTLYGRGQAARRNLVDCIRQIVRKRIERGSLETATDALGFMLNITDEDGNKFTETELINQSIGILFAGHETSSTIMSWVLFELGNHSEWCERLRLEYQQVVGEEAFALTHLRRLTLMTNVLKEGERMYSPSVGIIRGVVDEIEYGGYRISPGWNVVVSPMLTHRLPEIYSKPDTFDPDRFAPLREEDKQYPFSLIGFGGGNHFCLGIEFAQMQMKLILANLLQNYHWTVVPTAAEIEPVLEPLKMQKFLRMQLIPYPATVSE